MSVFHPGYAATIERGDDEDERGFPGPGAAVAYQASVRMLDLDDGDGRPWDVRIFPTVEAATAWAEARARDGLPSTAAPRYRAVRAVAVAPRAECRRCHGTGDEPVPGGAIRCLECDGAGSVPVAA